MEALLHRHFQMSKIKGLLIFLFFFSHQAHSLENQIIVKIENKIISFTSGDGTSELKATEESVNAENDEQQAN